MLLKIQIENGTKVWNHQQKLFEHLNFCFEFPKKYAIRGPNGSGKSTLLKILAGLTPLTQGSLILEGISKKEFYKSIVIVAPWMDIFEEYNPVEFLTFHYNFKPIKKPLNISDILEAIGLQNHVSKRIDIFSSGMKQRLKLAQALYSDVPIIFLDEPTMNLDALGVQWYLDTIKNTCKNQMVIVSSNLESELLGIDDGSLLLKI
ncbi:MAG: ATP-binding cassette domain-containing protein [Alphaproteobacteria bacterium]|nr:ATP-binding cassette domain-containing protein [Alphaproteobacteria bacterium]